MDAVRARVRVSLVSKGVWFLVFLTGLFSGVLAFLFWIPFL